MRWKRNFWPVALLVLGLLGAGLPAVGPVSASAARQAGGEKIGPPSSRVELVQKRRRRPPPPGRRRPPRRNDQDRALDAVRRGGARPLSQIIPDLQRHCRGGFLDASLEQIGRRLFYRVRLLSDKGRRMTLLVDARSGEIVRGRCP